MRALAPHRSRLPCPLPTNVARGSIPGVDASLLRGIFPGTPIFRPPQKPTCPTLQLNSTQKWWMKKLLCGSHRNSHLLIYFYFNSQLSFFRLFLVTLSARGHFFFRRKREPRRSLLYNRRCGYLPILIF